MIGRMRPFYQAHWDISKDIKHVWLLICTYYIAWIFQWILGDERRRKWWDRQYRVWIPQCAAPLDVTVTYARDSFVDSPAGPFVFSRGGPDILDVTVTYARDSFVDSPSVLRPGWHMQETALWIPRHIGTSLTVPPFGTVWATHRLPCSVTSVVERWYSVWRMTFCTRSIVLIKACVPCS